jgi:hypothetical protein
MNGMYVIATSADIMLTCANDQNQVPVMSLSVTTNTGTQMPDRFAIWLPTAERRPLLSPPTSVNPCPYLRWRNTVEH